MSTAPAPGAGVPADQAFVNNLITQSTTAGPWIDINTNYLLTSAYLVFFMHCGFAMVSHFAQIFATIPVHQQSEPTMQLILHAASRPCIL